jgi:hypothetical protein
VTDLQELGLSHFHNSFQKPSLLLLLRSPEGRSSVCRPVSISNQHSEKKLFLFVHTYMLSKSYLLSWGQPAPAWLGANLPIFVSIEKKLIIWANKRKSIIVLHKCKTQQSPLSILPIPGESLVKGKFLIFNAENTIWSVKFGDPIETGWNLVSV